jgi:hypothetical protein
MNWTPTAAFGLAPTLPGDLSESASPSSGILLESCDPAKSSLFHGPRITDHQPGRRSRNCPSLHSTSFFSISCGLLLHNGRPQPFSFQALPDSFHRHGGVYPLTQSAFREGPLPAQSPLLSRCASSRNASISFLFMPLRTLSFTTRGVHPSSRKRGSK